MSPGSARRRRVAPTACTGTSAGTSPRYGPTAAATRRCGSKRARSRWRSTVTTTRSAPPPWSPGSAKRMRAATVLGPRSAEQTGQPLDVAAEVEALDDEGAGCRPELPAERGVAQDASQRIGEAVHVARLDEQPRLLGHHDLGDAREPRRHHRRLDGKGLEDEVRNSVHRPAAVDDARMGQQGGTAQQRDELAMREPAGELDATGEAEGVDLT